MQASLLGSLSNLFRAGKYELLSKFSFHGNVDNIINIISWCRRHSGSVSEKDVLHLKLYNGFCMHAKKHAWGAPPTHATHTLEKNIYRTDYAEKVHWRENVDI